MNFGRFLASERRKSIAVSYTLPFSSTAGGMTVFSAIALWWLLGGTFKWTLYLSGFLTLGHALFRDAGSLQNQGAYTNPMIIPSDAGFYQGPQIVGA